MHKITLMLYIFIVKALSRDQLFKKSLEDTPLQPDLPETFRIVPLGTLGKMVAIIMPSCDYIVKSECFMIDTCKVDYISISKKGMNLESV